VSGVWVALEQGGQWLMLAKMLHRLEMGLRLWVWMRMWVMVRVRVRRRIHVHHFSPLFYCVVTSTFWYFI